MGARAGVVHAVADAAATPTQAWVDAFLDGFLRARRASTTSRWSAATPRAARCRSPSPCTASCRPGSALRRDGARVGDDDLGHRHARRCRRRRCAQWRAGGAASMRRCARAWTGRRRASPRAARCAASRTPCIDVSDGCSPTSATSAAPAASARTSSWALAGVADARGTLRCRGAAAPAAGRWRRLRTVLHRRAGATRRHRTIGREHVVAITRWPDRRWKRGRAAWMHMANPGTRHAADMCLRGLFDTSIRVRGATRNAFRCLQRQHLRQWSSSPRQAAAACPD